jgi:hypothetical protein
MKLIGFSISGDFIALERGSDRFDLHNNFEFHGLSYSSAQRSLELKWRRGPGDWVRPMEPSELLLAFSGVYLFKARERDPAMPFKEDSCLDSIGFMWDDMLPDMGAFSSHMPKDDCKHLTATFTSGFSIKVGADSVVLHITGGA